MFEVTIDKKKYDSQEIESVSIYNDGEGQSHAWVTFKKDVSKLVGLPINISSSAIRNFIGEIDSVESQTEYICKLYCIGVSSDACLENEKNIACAQSSKPAKELKHRKKK